MKSRIYLNIHVLSKDGGNFDYFPGILKNSACFHQNHPGKKNLSQKCRSGGAGLFRYPEVVERQCRVLEKGYWWIPIGPCMLRNRPSLNWSEASSGAKDEKLRKFEHEDEVQPFLECMIHKSPRTGGAKCRD